MQAPECRDSENAKLFFAVIPNVMEICVTECLAMNLISVILYFLTGTYYEIG